MKILRVGDPHVTVSNLQESEALIDFVIKTARDNSVAYIEFLGDLFHTHAVIRVEVLDFWRRTFLKLHYSGMKTLVLVGNHDQPGSKEKEQVMNALTVFSNAMPSLTVIDSPCIIDHGGKYMAAYCPYTSNESEFLDWSRGLYEQGAEKLIICHQTFNGAKYESGMYAPEGILPDTVMQETVLSGHIHSMQDFGKITYPGTARWGTMADANHKKGIWIYEHGEDGTIISKDFVSTEEVCTPIYKIVVEEGDKMPKLNEKARNYVELVGKTAWITKMKKKLKGKARIKSKPTDRKMERLSKEKTLDIVSFLNQVFEPIEGVKRTDIESYIRSFDV